MHFSKLIKTAGYQPAVKHVEEVRENESELVEFVKQYMRNPNNIQTMPHVLSEAILTDNEVNDMLEYLLEFHDKYFPTIPLEKDIIKQFLWNVPKSIIEGMRYAQTHLDCPDILNPVMFMYPLMMEKPNEAIGLFWNTLMPILDSNREAIKEDADAYLMDLRYEEDEEDE